jgi:SPP1 family predicted phage head-tail adaptor
MIYIQAGELDQLITLQQRASSAVDSHGQPSAAWEDVYADIRAKVDTRPGRDAFAAGQDQATELVTFRIRYRPNVHERMRVVWRTNYYEIVGRPIDVHGAKVAIDLQCVGGIGDGR